MDFNLKDKVALVTGGSHGLGMYFPVFLFSRGINIVPMEMHCTGYGLVHVITEYIFSTI